MQTPGDDVLIEQSRSGDMNAFKILVSRHEGKIAAVTKAMLGSTLEAEDVGQEVFIRFYESMHKFRGDSQLSTYLVRIAMNLSLNEIKKRKRNFLRFASIDAAMEIKEKELTSDLKEQVMYELGRLEPSFRAVVTLRLIEGYTTEETSELLDIPMGTVLSRLARAQKQLRVALSQKRKP
jgi:RNA polymerase sigma-70 factor, ECF subfamily